MKRVLSKQCPGYLEKQVLLKGWLTDLRKLGKIAFLILRDRAGFIQIVIEDKKELEKLKNLYVGTVLEIVGKVQKAEQTELKVELVKPKITVLEPVTDVPPIEYNKKEIKADFDTILDNRTISLRNEKLQAIFKIQAKVKEAFRKFLTEKDFVEISTPRLLAEASEGGANFFQFDYFYGKKAFLAQSPQFYKQIMVGVFERVFEIGTVFRAEKSKTVRHLSEYVSLDVEIGFIDCWTEILDLIDETVKGIIKFVWQNCQDELTKLGAKPSLLANQTPRFKISEIHEIYFKETGIDFRAEGDLEPEEEKFICEYAAKKFKSDLVFATQFPWTKRPFYTKRDEKNPDLTYGADLLYRGVEIVTGGQRENNYKTLIEQAKEKGVTVSKIQGYIDAFKYGMPKEGGFAIGSERLTQKIIGLANVKEATLFPRDCERLTP